MSLNIAKNAAVDPRANIADEVEIGPFCVVGPHVTIGRGTRLDNHVTISGHVTIGEFNHFYPNAVIGGEPQDLSYRGSDTCVQIGDRNVFRECVTVNRASEKEDGVTAIGSHCFLMACSHVGHDCQVGDHVVMANNVLLAGHVRVEHHATLAGASAVHQFATIGAYSFLTGMSRVIHDVPPYMLIDGLPARPRCVNVVALKRNNFSPEEIRALAEAYRLLFRAKVGVDQAREILFSNAKLLPAVKHLLSDVEAQQGGSHGRVRDRRRAA
jgi:UDP-N-acetylglucosamine acyltransferase